MEELFLDPSVLDHGLDHQVGRDEVVGGGDTLEHLRGIPTALLRELLEAPLHSLERPLDGAGNRVVQGHPAAGRRDDLRDSAPHLARPHDEHVRESHLGGV